MNESAQISGALRKILLATDLSARGDRALERAVSISLRHDVQLTILHVIEQFDESTLTYGVHGLPSWRRPPDAAEVMKQKIKQGLRSDLGDAVDKDVILIEEGNPAEVIQRTATSGQFDLVITGVAREGPFSNRPMVLGKTVEQLLRRLPVPILIVKDRPRDPYQHIVVTTDFSKPSAHALQMALRFFQLSPCTFCTHPRRHTPRSRMTQSCMRKGTAQLVLRSFESLSLRLSCLRMIEGV